MVATTVLSEVMGGTLATELIGLITCGAIIYYAVGYWRFLGTIDPVEVEP